MNQEDCLQPSEPIGEGIVSLLPQPARQRRFLLYQQYVPGVFSFWRGEHLAAPANTFAFDDERFTNGCGVLKKAAYCRILAGVRPLRKVSGLRTYLLVAFYAKKGFRTGKSQS